MKYLIWCHDRHQYWVQSRCGYTPYVKEAGRFSRKEAAKICELANVVTRNCLPPQESMLPDPDL